MDTKKVQQMLQTIRDEVRFSRSFTGRDRIQDRVLDAMAQVPREEFVPHDLRRRAYDNNALPIDFGQTISQPFIVALMTDLLSPEPDHVILEVGTGSGYQAAILSLLVNQVYSIEVVPELAAQARRRLELLGFTNVEVLEGDGYAGWPENASYDGIIVTAAASQVPPPLQVQLKPGGHLVIPIGQPYMHQELMVVEKDHAGKTTVREVLGVAFVPLVRGRGRGHRGIG